MCTRVTVIGVLLALLITSCRGQELLLKRFQDLSEHTQVPLDGVLLDLNRSAGVSAGMVLAEGCDGFPHVDLQFAKGSTLGESLAVLRQWVPALSWSENSGVLEIELNSAKLRGHLATQIKEFSWNDSELVPSVVARLLIASRLSEDMAAMGYKKRSRVGPGLMFVSRKTLQPVQLMQDFAGGAEHLSSGKMSEVLDEIVRSHPASVWVYQETICNGERLFDLQGY